MIKVLLVMRTLPMCTAKRYIYETTRYICYGYICYGYIFMDIFVIVSIEAEPQKIYPNNIKNILKN